MWCLQKKKLNLHIKESSVFGIHTSYAYINFADFILNNNLTARCVNRIAKELRFQLKRFSEKRVFELLQTDITQLIIFSMLTQNIYMYLVVSLDKFVEITNGIINNT